MYGVRLAAIFGRHFQGVIFGNTMSSFATRILPSMRSIRVVIDWDGTLTTRDTLHLVSNIGYHHNEGIHPPAVPWNEIVQAYIDDCGVHEQSYQPSKANRSTIAEESAWLSSLTAVESRSIKRVENAGIFKGVREEDIRRAGYDAVTNYRIEMRKGWLPLLFYKSNNQSTRDDSSIRTSILSVNWSTLFIRACLLQALTLHRDCESQLEILGPEHRIEMVQNLLIQANEIQGIGTKEGSSGLLSPSTGSGLRTSEDKLYVLQKLRTSENSLIIYIGDSATDFDALLFADIGICVRDEPIGTSQKELADTLQRLGITVQPLESLLPQHLKAKDGRKTIWWMRDLEEVTRLITRVQNNDD
jgi:hypothetical protein